MEIQIHIAGVERLDDAVREFDRKAKETIQAVHSVYAALNELGVEISQPADSPAD